MSNVSPNELRFEEANTILNRIEGGYSTALIDKAFRAIVELSPIPQAWAAHFTHRLNAHGVVLGELGAEPRQEPVWFWVPYLGAYDERDIRREGYVTSDGVTREPLALLSTEEDYNVTPEDTFEAGLSWMIGHVLLKSDPEAASNPALVIPEFPLTQELVVEALQRHFLNQPSVAA